MNRYRDRFEALAQAGRGAFIPFTVLGFPDAVRCAGQLELLARHADALELGIPFSDPVADGPTIQRAAARALDSGTTPRRALGLIASLRARHPTLPIGILVYANLVLRRQIGRFYGEAAEAGVDSVLIADVPSEEGGPFSMAARAAGVAPVFIAPPNADAAALDRIARLGGAYTYVLTRSGVTGVERAPEHPAQTLLAELRERGAPPPVLGFGVSRPEEVAGGIAAGAVGVISGSAVVARLEALADARMRPGEVAGWLAGMRAATRP